MADKRYVRRVLTDDEHVVLQFGYHWLYFMKLRYFLAHIIPLIFALVLGYWFAFEYEWDMQRNMYLALLALTCFYMFIASFIWKVITSDVRIVTNKRLTMKTGFISRETNEIKLSAIEAITIRQNPLQRILRIGTLSVEARGGGEPMKILYVRRPLMTKHTIENVNWSESISSALAS